jgi:hypothetical protein
MEPEIWEEGDFTTFVELDIYDIEASSATSTTQVRIMIDESGNPVILSRQII